MGCIVASSSAATPAIRWDKRISRLPCAGQSSELTRRNDEKQPALAAPRSLLRDLFLSRLPRSFISNGCEQVHIRPATSPVNHRYGWIEQADQTAEKHPGRTRL